MKRQVRTRGDDRRSGVGGLVRTGQGDFESRADSHGWVLTAHVGPELSRKLVDTLGEIADIVAGPLAD